MNMSNLEQQLLDKINKELEDYKKEIAKLDNETFISRAKEIDDIMTSCWFWQDGIKDGRMILSEDYLFELLDKENLIDYISFDWGIEVCSKENLALQFKLREEYLDFKKKVAMLSNEEKIDKSFPIVLFKEAYDRTIEGLRSDETYEEELYKKVIENVIGIDNLIYKMVFTSHKYGDDVVYDLAEILGIEDFSNIDYDAIYDLERMLGIEVYDE